MSNEDPSQTQVQEMVPFMLSPMAWIQDHQLAVPTSKPHQCSPFERLPLELRQEIYHYLGVPLVGYKFVYSCSSEGDEARMRLAMNTNTPTLRLQLWSLSTLSYYANVGFEKSLLAVCRTTRFDTLNLLFHKIPVYLATRFKLPKQIRTASYFPLITILHLQYPSTPEDWLYSGSPKWRNRMLVEQAEALIFFAEHCAQLRELRFHPYLSGVPQHEFGFCDHPFKVPGTELSNFGPQRAVPKPKQSLIRSLVLGLGLLARKCNFLETIDIPQTVRAHYIRPNGRMLSYQEFMDEAPMIARLMYPQVEVHMYKFDLTRLPAFDREEEVKTWAEQVLGELVKRGSAYDLQVLPFPQPSG